MATLKKNAMNQILFTMVDKTDFASIESGITASSARLSMAAKYYGVAHGGSAAYTSGAVSKPVRLVASGLFNITLKNTECNYDYLAVRVKHASCADQLMVFEMATANDADLSAAISDTQSYLVALSGLISDAHSQAARTYSRALLVASDASDTLSMVRGLSSIGSDLYSLLTVVGSNVSDTQSQATRTYSRVLLAASNISDVQSYLVALSAQVSDIDSALTSQYSDVISKVGGITVTLTDSNISDIASAVAAAVGSSISDIQSYLVGMSGMLSDTHSQAARTYSRTLLAASNISDVQSYLVALSAQVSDIDSTLASQYSDVISKIGGITTSIDASAISDIASRVKAVLDSDLSDILSSARSARSVAVLNASAISDVQSYLAGMSAVLSDVDSGVKATQSLASDAHSQAARTYSRALLNASAISDVQSYLADLSGAISDLDSKLVLMDSDLSDVHSAATEARKLLRNRMKVMSDTGVARLYDDNNTTVLMSGAITADGDSTLRTRLG